MRFFIFAVLTFWTVFSFGQTNQSASKGTTFKTTPGEYFEKVIKPWKYQYSQAEGEIRNESVKKIGRITFWRSKAIYDDVSKKYWKPDISFDIFPESDSAYLFNLADNIKAQSSCDVVNRGGDILVVGHFILISSSPCVNCASSSNIDYCRNIIRNLFESVSNKDTYDWNAILKQLVIDKGKF